MLRNPFLVLRPGRAGNRGAAAIEFAMIAPVLFLLLFASFETGLSYFANSTLQNGVLETARLIRTGQAAKQNLSKTQFRQMVCDEVKTLLSCDADKLYIDVRAFTSFNASSYPPPIDQDGNLSGNLDGFNLGQSSMGGGETIILYRALYKWQLFTPLFSKYFANMAGDIRLMSVSMAFRNEPY